jgi:hypothetical protein
MMRRTVELAAFLTLGTVLGTIGFRLYKSPDGKALWDYLGSSRQPQSNHSEWMKEVKTPEWKFEHNPLVVPTQDWNLGGGELPWKSTGGMPAAQSRPAGKLNTNTSAKLWNERFKVHTERMKAHHERMKAHTERMNSAPSAWSERPSASATGPRLGQNPFAH